MEYDNTLDFLDEDQIEEYEEAFQSHLLKHGASFLENLMESLRSGEDIQDGESNDFGKNHAKIFEILIETFNSDKKLLSLADLVKLGINEELIYRIGQISCYRIGQISLLDQQEEQDEEALNCESIDSDSEDIDRKSGSKCDNAAKESDDYKKTFDSSSSSKCAKEPDEEYSLMGEIENEMSSDSQLPIASAKSDDLEKTFNVFDHSSQSSKFSKELDDAYENEMTSDRQLPIAAKSSKSSSWVQRREWSLGECIGTGAFGEVYQAMNRKGQLFAVKKLNTNKIGSVTKIEKEVRLMMTMHHPNIVAYVDTLRDPENAFIYIFQEFIPGGSVEGVLKKYGPLSLDIVAIYTQHILSGLKYLHDNKIIHRDIKAANILVDENGIVKLADFGTSTNLDKISDMTLDTKSISGTPFFMAPEVLSNSHYGRKGDIWALGCTVFQLLTAEVPWKKLNPSSLVELHIILQNWGKGPPDYECPDTPMSRVCRDFLNKCFEKDESKRATAEELLTHEFLSMDEDSLELMSHVRFSSANCSGKEENLKEKVCVSSSESAVNPFGHKPKIGAEQAASANPFGKSKKKVSEQVASANPFGKSEQAASANPFGKSNKEKKVSEQVASANPFGKSEQAASANPFGKSNKEIANTFGHTSNKEAEAYDTSIEMDSKTVSYDDVVMMMPDANTFDVGMNVRARKGGYHEYLKGKIVKLYSNKSYDIEYLNGETENLDECYIEY